MKLKFKLLIFVILIQCPSYAQRWIPEAICSKDTLIVQPIHSKKKGKEIDTLFVFDTLAYQIVRCETRSNLGFRMELGFSNYYYGKNMTSWIGQHGSPNFNFYAVYKKLTFGIRMKPWTIDPKRMLVVQNQLVPTNAQLNVIKSDIILGYSLDFNRLLSIEPFVGLNTNNFVVINEDDINQDFSFQKIKSPIGGVTINKYFKIKEHEYLSLFSTLGYSLAYFMELNPTLEPGYFEWNIGLAYKGFGIKHFTQRIN